MRPFTAGLCLGIALMILISAAPPPNTTQLALEIAGLKQRVAALELIMSGADPHILANCLRSSAPTPAPRPAPTPPPEPTPYAQTGTPPAPTIRKPIETPTIAPTIAPTVSPIPLPGATLVP
jgi:hypothetical protein